MLPKKIKMKFTKTDKNYMCIMTNELRFLDIRNLVLYALHFVKRVKSEM